MITNNDIRRASVKTNTQMVKGLLCAAFFILHSSFFIPAMAQQYEINPRSGILHGMVSPRMTAARAGETVTVVCKPDDGYGLSKGAFFGVKNEKGEYTLTEVAKNTSTYPDDRANEEQTFTFTMPAANVEVWADFVPVRIVKIHQTEGGKLKPVYGVKKADAPDSTVVRNVPLKPLKFHVIPNDGYELLDVKFENIEPKYCTKTSSLITITIPPDDGQDIIHVTPTFSKNTYKVEPDATPEHIQMTVSNLTPKAREEVTVELLCDKGYIPKDFTIKGCDGTWWLVDQPEKQSDGKWKVVYRFKVGLQNVSISVNQERVYAVNVSDTQNTGRIKTYIPEMIPGFPGLARSGQQVPVVFMMPGDFSAEYNVQGNPKSQVLYHNELRNSFADEGMTGWTETNDYINAGLQMKVFTASPENYYWQASAKNIMRQSVSIAGRSFPANAKNGSKLRIAAIASINPCHARSAKVSIVATGKDMTESQLTVADLSHKPEGWQTVYFTGEVNDKAETLTLQVDSEGEDQSKSRSYEGPMFDDLCLLIPTEGKTIRNEDVLNLTIDNSDITVNYTPSGKQGTVSVQKNSHATVTLRNVNTEKEGETIQAVENDVIQIVAQADEGYAVYQVRLSRPGMTALYLSSDSIDVEARKVYCHYTKTGTEDETIQLTVAGYQVYVKSAYGGTVKVENAKAQKGEKVVFTVTPNEGCKLRQIKTSPAGIVTISKDDVDDVTGAGKYSFIMPTSYIRLLPEFTVPIATTTDLESISSQPGEFLLTEDLDLGNSWNKRIFLSSEFNGNGHRITYGGQNSLFYAVSGSVRHLYVTANTKGSGSGSYVGGIAMINSGLIEDCEVSGTITNPVAIATLNSYAGGVAGQNTGGTISHCHVVFDAIDAPTSCGIAWQGSSGTIKDNVFNSQFGASGKHLYMVSNDRSNCTIEGNTYIANPGNSKAEVISGVTPGTTDELVEQAKDLADTYPVFAASIKKKYSNVYNVNLQTSTDVQVVNRSGESAVPGAVVTASVRVTGNNHLESIYMEGTDGSNRQSVAFTDDTENGYAFSFTMPEHDVNVVFQTKTGRLIQTSKNLIDINNVPGTYYLVRDITLNNWGKQLYLNGTFYGDGHTIQYNASSSCYGLFYEISNGALLQGLRIIGDVKTETNCGGIAFTNNGTIRDCHFNGSITKTAVVTSKKKKASKEKVAALVCIMSEAGSVVDHCSATGELKSAAIQDFINEHPLCSQTGANIAGSDWVSPTQTDKYQELTTTANAALKDYPVYAQGILDKVTPRYISGSTTGRMEQGQTLDELTITDGEPFLCTDDIKVNRVIYKRKTMTELEQWVLPFAFDRIAGSGSFEYHETMKKERALPTIEPGQTLTLSNTPSSVSYQPNEPWLVKGDGGDFVLTSSAGPIIIKATHHTDIKSYASAVEEGHFYATYDNIPAKEAANNLIYRWNGTKQEFELADGGDIPPFRFYLQFYNKTNKEFVKYTQTEWGKKEAAESGNRAAKASAPRRAANVMADGWQPVFLDPRQPQSITASMLDYYEVACLTDVNADVFDEEADEPLAVVSLVYQQVDSHTDIPAALPLLVRAKRSDAKPLADAQTGDELDDADTDLPHYWCAAYGNRLDIWALPSSERYADLSEYNAMMFEDNYFDQSFLYADATDNRATAPMSYCITVLNEDTYERLPLIGDRVYVEFLPAASETTGIETVKSEKIKDKSYYNLSGQRVDASYKGIVIQNGRKVIKR